MDIGDSAKCLGAELNRTVEMKSVSAKHVIASECADEYINTLVTIHKEVPRRFYMRNYLLNKTQIDTIDMRSRDFGCDADHLEWTLGLGIANKESLMIQHKLDLDNGVYTIKLRSKLRPLGTSLQ
jgi:hypothetical protein